MIGVVSIVHAAADVLHAIGHHQIVNVEEQIVGRNLIENPLRQLDAGRFVFDDHLRMGLLVVEDGVQWHAARKAN